MTVTAREYAYDGAPDSLDAGPTTFRLINGGREQHFLGLVRIARPHTVAEYHRTLAQPGPTPPWVTAVGGVGTLDPGAHAMTTLDLTPGLYALVCDMTDAHGTPHMLEGMLRPLVVRPRPNGRVLPTADIQIDLADFAFGAPTTVPPGPHTIGIRNSGTQSHMALLWQLHPGQTVTTALHWFTNPTDPSPSPVTFMGGVPDLGPAQAVQVPIDLAAGHYLLICLVEDPRDHRAHYAKGMLKEVVVAAAGR